MRSKPTNLCLALASCLTAIHRRALILGNFAVDCCLNNVSQGVVVPPDRNRAFAEPRESAVGSTGYARVDTLNQNADLQSGWPPTFRHGLCAHPRDEVVEIADFTNARIICCAFVPVQGYGIVQVDTVGPSDSNSCDS
jgi:hypothetical protein